LISLYYLLKKLRLTRQRASGHGAHGQIYGACIPPDVGPLLQSVTGCLKYVADWMSAKRLHLNSDKTEFMSGPLIGSTLVSPSATVRDLGVFIDQDLTMKTHVQRTASRCFATLRQLRSIRRYMPTPVFQALVSAFVLSLLINLLLIHIQRLQSVQNAAARLIFNLRRCDHITDALISLHWLRVPERTTFKVAMLTLHGSAPPYLASSFTCVADMPHRCRLRSASTERPEFQPAVG